MNYQKVYGQIIERAIREKRDWDSENYYERHHIVPKCMKGEGKVREWKTHPNLVVLTAREHFICHWLLCRIYPENPKLAHAFWFMTKQKTTTQQRNYTVSSRTYAEAVSNLKFTQEHKDKIRKTRVGKKAIVHPVTKDIKYVAKEELEHWVELGWENTNLKKGMKLEYTVEGKKRIAEARRREQTGKTGLQAQAAKGPYTVEFKDGRTYIEGSYPELAKTSGIKMNTLHSRHVKGTNDFFNGWKIYGKDGPEKLLRNTNNNSRVFKGMKSDMTLEGREKLAEARRKDQTGKTGLQAKAAKGPYTVEFEDGRTYTEGSYPELAKTSGLKMSTLQYRHVKGTKDFLKGWKVY